MVKERLETEADESAEVATLKPDTPPPSFLDRHGKDLWRRLVADASAVRGADSGAYTTLALACDAYSEFRQAKKDVQKHGLTYVTTEGNIREYPAVAIQRAARRQLNAYLTELGMTPASKKKVVTAKITDDDPAQKYFT